MIELYIFIIIVILIIIIIIVARLCDVKIVSLREGKIEFWKPRKEKALSFRPCFSIDPVISRDGKIYKLHLIVSLLTTKDLNPTNWRLKIRGLNSMVFKQYFFQDNYGNRKPLGKIANLPMKINENFIIGLEFEPERDYNPFNFQDGIYEAELACEILEKIQKIKLRFRVRKRNLRAIELAAIQAINDKEPKVVSLPIVI